ncbi:SHOCT domain-containing protein, partial [Clostridium butyricum]
AKKDNEQILEIKGYIENYIENKNNYRSQNTSSDADELMKFKKLLDMGAITEEEYENKKEQILKL